ncbi:hypothetical protein LJ737_26465 [Hymenobacter sp. 15J16-1T3B]|uniref:hypothetical protein n=1 Tax=Hymenobacter sp. 15J16-1T3B TaxID=2886941 RepID=UPI001D11A146|nr:hypothetical protein [Hymenobacter sp. 15J16-1T3B]MCC3160809.1 hypothetical protein [Hymenobacter sp. 15J16-1T3B]
MAHHTVIGVFEDASRAQQAAQELEAHDVRHEHIAVAVHDPLNPTPPAAHGVIEDIFHTVFNSDSEAQRYAELARHGTTVTVHASSDEEAARARTILDRCSAEDATAYAQQLRSGWLNADASNRASRA